MICFKKVKFKESVIIFVLLVYASTFSSFDDYERYFHNFTFNESYKMTVWRVLDHKINVDGVADEFWWNVAESLVFNGCFWMDRPAAPQSLGFCGDTILYKGPSDIKAVWKFLYDSTNLYILCRVTDDFHSVSLLSSDWSEDDNIEVSVHWGTLGRPPLFQHIKKRLEKEDRLVAVFDTNEIGDQDIQNGKQYASGDSAVRGIRVVADSGDDSTWVIEIAWPIASLFPHFDTIFLGYGFKMDFAVYDDDDTAVGDTTHHALRIRRNVLWWDTTYGDPDSSFDRLQNTRFFGNFSFGTFYKSGSYQDSIFFKNLYCGDSSFKIEDAPFSFKEGVIKDTAELGDTIYDTLNIIGLVGTEILDSAGIFLNSSFKLLTNFPCTISNGETRSIFFSYKPSYWFERTSSMLYVFYRNRVSGIELCGFCFPDSQRILLSPVSLDSFSKETPIVFDTFYFDTAVVGDTARDSLYVLNLTSQRIIINSIQTTSPCFALDTGPLDVPDTLSSGGCLAIPISFIPSTGSFLHSAHIRLEIKNQSIKYLVLRGFGYPKGPLIKTDRAVIDFGEVVQESTVYDTIIITNQGTDSLKISSMVFYPLSLNFFLNEVSDSLLMPGETVFVTIEFISDSLDSFGEYSTYLRIESNSVSAWERSILLKALVVGKTGINHRAYRFPKKFALESIAPNPFTYQLRFNFAVPTKTFVFIGVFDLKGRLIHIVANNIFEKGFYNGCFNGCDTKGKRLGSGTYILKLISGNYIFKRKIVFAK